MWSDLGLGIHVIETAQCCRCFGHGADVDGFGVCERALCMMIIVDKSKTDGRHREIDRSLKDAISFN